jgi:hypothetical protein
MANEIPPLQATSRGIILKDYDSGETRFLNCHRISEGGTDYDALAVVVAKIEPGISLSVTHDYTAAPGAAMPSKIAVIGGSDYADPDAQVWKVDSAGTGYVSAVITGQPLDVDVLTIAGGSNTIGKVGVDSSVSVVDANNSTTTPLGIAGVFTGTGTEVLDYSFITVMISADEDSAADGMQFQFSTDNSNWDDSYDFNIDASESTTRRFQFPVTGRYFRIVYTNGGTAQGYFRAQTLLHPHSSITSIHRISGDVSDDRSCELTKSVLVAKKPNGEYVNIEATAGGNLKVAVEEFDTELPAGTQNLGEIDVVGNVAHGSADSGDPLKIGGKASTSRPTAVSNAQRVNAWFEEYGRLVVADMVPDWATGAYKLVNSSGAAWDTIKAAPGANLALVITTFTAINTSTTSGRLLVRDSTPSQFWEIPLAIEDGGQAIPITRAIILGTNKSLQAQVSAAGMTVYVNVATIAVDV